MSKVNERFSASGFGRIDVDFYDVGSSDIWLEVTDSDGPARSALVHLKPKKARKVGKALIAAAKQAKR